MGSARTKRRLAAIVAADVVGYSRLMSENEERTLRILNQRLSIFQETIPRHDGRIFGGAGDSVVAEFPSAVEAVNCAVEVQQALALCNAEAPKEEHMQFRIGISVGDVVVDGDNLMGDGVNIASRLESLAEPGGINISADVYHQVHNKVQVGFHDLGPQALKNIPDPIQAYQVATERSATTGSNRPRRTRVAAPLRLRFVAAGAIAALVAVVAVWFASQHGSPPPRIETPSIAVLPFTNLSGDPSEDYFSDGMTNDLITSLSRLAGLFVIASNSVFTYKGTPVRVQEVSRDLGVRYVLEGSVQRAGNRVRINAQLIDAVTGHHLWADRFDRELTDVFALQDDVAQKIVAALEVKLTRTEQRALAHTYTRSIEAYDYFLRGQALLVHLAREDNPRARELFQKAIEIDPGFARAHAALALTHAQDFRFQWADTARSAELALELATKAVALDSNSPQAHWVLGYVYLFVTEEHDRAIAMGERTIELDPNHADGYGLLAATYVYAGQPERAKELIETAMRLDPRYPSQYPSILGLAHLLRGSYGEALTAWEDALTINATRIPTNVFLTILYTRLGRLDDARWQAQELVTIEPDFDVDTWASVQPFRDRSVVDGFVSDLHTAGLE